MGRCLCAGGLAAAWILLAGGTLRTAQPAPSAQAVFVAAAAGSTSTIVTDPPGDALQVMPVQLDFGPFTAGQAASSAVALNIGYHAPGLPLRLSVTGGLQSVVARLLLDAASDSSGLVRVDFVNPAPAVAKKTTYTGDLVVTVGNGWEVARYQVHVVVTPPPAPACTVSASVYGSVYQSVYGAVYEGAPCAPDPSDGSLSGSVYASVYATTYSADSGSQS